MLDPALTPAPDDRPPLLRTMVGDVLRRIRLEQRRTLADVARAARVSMPYLSELERGRKEASLRGPGRDLRRPAHRAVRPAGRGRARPGRRSAPGPGDPAGRRPPPGRRPAAVSRPGDVQALLAA